MQAKAKGYLFGAIAAATYGMNPLFALPLYKAGMTPDSVLFFRYLFALPMLALMIRLRGRNFRIQRTEGYWLFVMGLLMALSSLALFQSYNYMEAGIASTLLFVYPVMVAVLMSVVFHERLNGVTLLSIALVAVGVGLLYETSDGHHLNPTGTMLVGLSALAYAIYIVAINRGALQQMATLKVTFYVLLFGLSLFAVRLLVKGDIDTPTHWYLWGNLIALALFPTTLSLLCTTASIQRIGATPTAILGALEPVTAIFFGVTLFGEHLSLREAGGVALIILAVSLVIAAGSVGQWLLRLRKLFPRIPRKP